MHPPTQTDDAVLRWGSAATVAAAGEYFEQSAGATVDKLAAFPRFVDSSSLARFLVKYELSKLIGAVQGSIIECGVHDGGGLFTWAKISSLLEPLNHRRRVVGFDTFQGFPSVHEADTAMGGGHAVVGNYAGAAVEELRRGVALHDARRPMAHVPKVELVAGDFLETGPRYVAEHPHLVVSLLYLDFDIYEPTRAALDLFLPLMPAGAVVAFDEVHSEDFPGETTAMTECLDLSRTQLQRLPMTSICWAVLTGDERR